MRVDLPIPEEADFQFAYLRRFRGDSWYVGISTKYGIRDRYGSSLGGKFFSAEDKDPVIACNKAAAELVTWLERARLAERRPAKPVAKADKSLLLSDDEFANLLGSIGRKSR